jgi:hypothetical protein
MTTFPFRITTTQRRITSPLFFLLFLFAMSGLQAGETPSKTMPPEKSDSVKPEASQKGVPIEDGYTSILGAGSRWKRNFVLFPPVISDKAAKELGIDLKDIESRKKVLLGSVRQNGSRKSEVKYHTNISTEIPPNNWMMPEFDDSAWLNDQASDFNTGRDFYGGKVGKLYRTKIGDSESWFRGQWGADVFVKEVGLITQRGNFLVNDPGKIEKLNLSLVYRGGFVAYLNGKEIARGHLPKGEINPKTPAEEYPPDTKSYLQKERHSGLIEIDPALLEKGINILAIESHRSEYGSTAKKKGLEFAAVGMSECTLSAKAPASAIVSSFSQPDGLIAWNQHLWESTHNTEFGNFAEPLRPIKIVGAKNGSFSGKVIVGSTQVIEGLSAEMGDLKTKDGQRIISKAIQVRYGKINPLNSNPEALWKRGYSGVRFDAIVDAAPEKVPLARIDQKRVLSALLGVPQGLKPVAVSPIWVTVNIPKDAASGDYNGVLTVNSQGNEPVTVPVNLTVTEWTLPDIQDYGSLFFIYQSTDTLAKYFNVKPWSEEHWAMIESSLKLMGEVGNIGLILPLQAESAMGNAESLILWIKKEDGTFDYDFSRFDRYLETALKYHHVDRLKVVSLNVWGSENKQKMVKTKGADGKTKKVLADNARTLITVVDKASGKKEKMLMPFYGTPEAEAMWRPVLLKVKEKLEAKEVFSKAMFGMAYDVTPQPGHVRMFRNILGDIPWFRESHFDRRTFGYDSKDKTKAVPVGCNSIVWGAKIPDPTEKRLYGWRYNPKHMVLNFNRAGTQSVVLFGFTTPWTFRMWMESTLTAGRNGNGRCGGDFFRNGYSSGTGNHGCMFGAYPRSQVAQTGLGNGIADLFAAGEDGPVTSVRFENAREGNQEAEARIVIERALLNKTKPLPAELAQECRVLLDYRTNMMRMWAVTQTHTEIASVGWQENNHQLFQLAAEVEKLK